ncbi:uncharacterized protein LOC129585887 isoform X2 [Paramacrobiotus metropolitanus]|uniref:uncharacterized protein LOC129585887 isoform X2 n=1 Tax=Paramacrobiotus metropolitanus TaxID=2943436 RepID=UPI0024465B4A|nr:uncharacterized protein LOC129585887 isoform X2 [Paramacrobiotus metropolitanus]
MHIHMKTGGIRVELISEMYDRTLPLIPASRSQSDWFGNDSIATALRLTLPQDFFCTNCVLRLLKQDLTMSAPDGSPHVYWSCADINIVRNDVVSFCSGRGQWDPRMGECICSPRFSGPVCQYEDECSRDAECGNGQCVDIQSSSFPSKQCYCAIGFHGSGCRMRSSVTDPSTFTPQSYQTHQLTAGMKFFWRVLPDLGEIEMVLQFKNQNWIAVGWKPYGISSSCKMFPNLPRERRQSRNNDGSLRVQYVDYFDNSSLFFQSPLHPMACSDIVWAAIRGSYSRIRDMYTRDMSTPRDDAFFNGADSLTAAVGSEDVSGMATLIFRKKLQTNELSDQSIGNGWTTLIWAVGQGFGMPGDDPQWQVSSDNEAQRIRNFYRRGELKSHGHSAEARGTVDINFYTGQVLSSRSFQNSNSNALIQENLDTYNNSLQKTDEMDPNHAGNKLGFTYCTHLLVLLALNTVVYASLFWRN